MLKEVGLVSAQDTGHQRVYRLTNERLKPSRLGQVVRVVLE
ncbi:hypothetical protein FRUB_03781 [Fimbriiglobus ruber]|uniref:Uncharacterized protein n=1 Tax=Fimbriiglobus ruber TaxID=1908690 RepID=A0A225DL66_9BACT|nr:hypothetical protein FRUB_03781 [Fimbriiglobus ruber]